MSGFGLTPTAEPPGLEPATEAAAEAAVVTGGADETTVDKLVDLAAERFGGVGGSMSGRTREAAKPVSRDRNPRGTESSKSGDVWPP